MAGRNMAALGMRPEQIKCRYCARWKIPFSDPFGWCLIHKKLTDPDNKCRDFVREPGADDDIDEGEK
jgi:hypothetical protein